MQNTMQTVFYVGLLIFGCAALGMWEFNRRHGTSAEGDLTVAQGVAYDAREVRPQVGDRTRLCVVEFSIDGHATEYASDRPGYDEVLAAVAGGKPMRVWVSTRRETLFEPERLQLYQLDLGRRRIVSYAQTVARHEKGSKAALIVGTAAACIGGWGMAEAMRGKGGKHVPPTDGN
jgi:hypothetical protein